MELPPLSSIAFGSNALQDPNSKVKRLKLSQTGGVAITMSQNNCVRIRNFIFFTEIRVIKVLIVWVSALPLFFLIFFIKHLLSSKLFLLTVRKTHSQTFQTFLNFFTETVPWRCIHVVFVKKPRTKLFCLSSVQKITVDLISDCATAVVEFWKQIGKLSSWLFSQTCILSEAGKISRNSLPVEQKTNRSPKTASQVNLRQRQSRLKKKHSSGGLTQKSIAKLLFGPENLVNSTLCDESFKSSTIARWVLWEQTWGKNCAESKKNRSATEKRR